MTATIPFMGFTPSVDPTTPGAVLDCTNMIPTLRGMRSAPSPVPVGNPVFPLPATGAATCQLLNGGFRTFVGTSAKLYEVVGNLNNDVSGSAYTGGANRWRFVQFGNATVATNGSDILQQSISAGAFAAIAGSPKAAIIEVVSGFVFLFNTIDTTNGTRTNGWFCSGLFDQTNWTPAQATQCANGVIVDTPGPITAGRALGTNIIAFKKNSMYYGTYQGPPVIWAFNQISPIVGTPTQEAVVNVGTNLFFLGSDYQVYSFDGTRPEPIGDEVREWLADNWSAVYQANVQSYHDEPNSLIYWYFASKTSAAGQPDRCLVLNYRTGKFGRADMTIECATQAISGQITWDGMGSLPGVTTWDTLPSIPYNSPYWSQASQLPAIIDSTNTLQSLTGASLASSLTSGFFGDDSDYQQVQGILPRFKQQPTSCKGSANLLKSLGSNQISQATLGDMYDGELACDFSTRWCQIVLNFTGTHEILGALPRVQPAGSI